MAHIHPNRAGLAFAAVLAGWHAVWALLVAFGGAQKVLDFAYKLHFMESDAVVGPFAPAIVTTSAKRCKIEASAGQAA